MKSFGVVFPGQGSQRMGMLADIAKEFRQVTDAYAEASQILGYDLWNIVQKGPETILDQTVYTQPIVLVGSYAIWRIIQDHVNRQPVILAGHSLGEYTALLCAGALSFQQAVRLVASRSEYMQQAVPVGKGALAAIIGLDDSAVVELCSQAICNHEVLAPVNYNSPGQIVVGGDMASVQRAILLAKNAGARMATLLPVSVPSHCTLMKPAAEKLKHCLSAMTLHELHLPVMNNVDVLLYTDAHSIQDGLVRQLYMPVRWVNIIQSFVHQGVSHVVECGPGKVLTGLNKRISPEIQLTHTADLNNLQALLKTLST